MVIKPLDLFPRHSLPDCECFLHFQFFPGEGNRPDGRPIKGSKNPLKVKENVPTELKT